MIVFLCSCLKTSENRCTVQGRLIRALKTAVQFRDVWSAHWKPLYSSGTSDPRTQWWVNATSFCVAVVFVRSILIDLNIYSWFHLAIDSMLRGLVKGLSRGCGTRCAANVEQKWAREGAPLFVSGTWLFCATFRIWHVVILRHISYLACRYFTITNARNMLWSC